MMKKRIALLGLLGCMALCSERVQAVTVLFDGQIYELSDRENIRYESLNRIKAGETQADVNARLKAFFEPLDHKIVASTSTVAPKPTMVPPVPAAPTQAQLDAAAARRASAMSVTPVRATAASASAAQSSEMCCSGRHRKPSACACVPVTPQRSIMAQDALSAKRMAFSRMDPSDPCYAGLKAEFDAASAACAQELSNQMEQMQVGRDSENQDEEADLNAAIMASMQQSTSPALSTGSVTPPAAVEENVRPHDVQYREVMLVQPVGMSDEVWEMVKGGEMTIDEATEYLLVMAQAEREAAEAAANQAAIRLAQAELEREEEAANAAAMRAAQVDLEEQAVKDLLKAERMHLLIEKFQAYTKTKQDLGLSINEVVDMVATEVVLEAAERAALQAAFAEAEEAAGLEVLRQRLTQ